jgi:GT2 family glycosyltransferase
MPEQIGPGACRTDLFVIPTYSGNQIGNAKEIARMAAESGFQPVIVCNGARAASALSGHPYALSSGENTGYGGAADLVAERMQFDTLVLCNDDMSFTSGAMRALRSAVNRLDLNDRASVMGFLPSRGTRVFPLPTVFGVIALVSGLSAITRRLGNRHLRCSFSLPPVSPGGDDKQLPRGLAFPFVCVAITRKAWDALDGFDSRFPLYFEDMDVLARAHRSDAVGVSVAVGDCAHSLSSSTRTVLPYALPLMSIGARTYLQLHHEVSRVFACALVTAGLALRIVLWLPVRPNRKSELSGILRSMRAVWSLRDTAMPPW